MSLCSRMHVTPCYGELSMESVTSCKNTSAFTAQIAHSLKGRGGLSEESEHTGETLKAELEVLTFEHQRRIIGLLICNLSAQKGSISGRIRFAFPLCFDIQAKLHRRIEVGFFYTLSSLQMEFD